MNQWSSWAPFPDPRCGAYVTAPYGPGVYQLHNTDTGEYVLFGCSRSVAWRLTSLLPPPYGRGIRRNTDKRKYVLNNISFIVYRTKACSDFKKAQQEEGRIRREHAYLFPT